MKASAVSVQDLGLINGSFSQITLRLFSFSGGGASVNFHTSGCLFLLLGNPGRKCCFSWWSVSQILSPHPIPNPCHSFSDRWKGATRFHWWGGRDGGVGSGCSFLDLFHHPQHWDSPFQSSTISDRWSTGWGMQVPVCASKREIIIPKTRKGKGRAPFSNLIWRRKWQIIIHIMSLASSKPGGSFAFYRCDWLIEEIKRRAWRLLCLSLPSSSCKSNYPHFLQLVILFQLSSCCCFLLLFLLNNSNPPPLQHSSMGLCKIMAFSSHRKSNLPQPLLLEWNVKCDFSAISHASEQHFWWFILTLCLMPS